MSEEILVKIVTKYEVKIRRFRLSENWHVVTSYHMPGLGTQESLLFSLFISHLLQLSSFLPWPSVFGLSYREDILHSGYLFIHSLNKSINPIFIEHLLYSGSGKAKMKTSWSLPSKGHEQIGKRVVGDVKQRVWSLKTADGRKSDSSKQDSLYRSR